MDSSLKRYQEGAGLGGVNSGPSRMAQRGNLVGRVAADQATYLETAFPVREISLLAEAERRSNDKVYGAHRWWARRPPALMRAVILASTLRADCSDADFWAAYAEETSSLDGFVVKDPFAGGGTTLVEALRLGAAAFGSDIDPLAVEITRHELHPAPAADVTAAGYALLEHLNQKVGHLYPKGPQGTPLHYFWLHQVTCPNCGHRGPLYKSLVLARDAGKAGAVVRDQALTAFSPEDLSIHYLAKPDAKVISQAGRRLRLDAGTYRHGKYRCPSCESRWTHAELQTGVAPRQLIAVEDTTDAHRRLRAPNAADLAAVATAAEVVDRGEGLQLPNANLKEDRRDRRPLSFGIRTAQELHTDRQLAVFGFAMQWVADSELRAPIRRALVLALSSALTTNNRLCSYAVDYGRLSPLFSVRGYAIPALPVELNPLHPDSGRGTLQHCIDRVADSAAATVRRHIWSMQDAAPLAKRITFDTSAVAWSVVCRSADTKVPPMAEPLADLCLFDPPYFDNISYRELSEMHRAWLSLAIPPSEPLMPYGSDPALSFGKRFGQCLLVAQDGLKSRRPLAFTYHSSNPEAWKAIGVALDHSRLSVTALWPIRSDGHMGHHSHPGNCEWDLVLVCRRSTETLPLELNVDVADWIAKAAPLAVGPADRKNMALAIEAVGPRYARIREDNGRRLD